MTSQGALEQAYLDPDLQEAHTLPVTHATLSAIAGAFRSAAFLGRHSAPTPP